MVQCILAFAAAFPSHAAMEEICDEGSLCGSLRAPALLQTISKQNETTAPSKSDETSWTLQNVQMSKDGVFSKTSGGNAYNAYAVVTMNVQNIRVRARDTNKHKRIG